MGTEGIFADKREVKEPGRGSGPMGSMLLINPLYVKVLFDFLYKTNPRSIVTDYTTL
jgi:hypothetical protein